VRYKDKKISSITVLLEYLKKDLPRDKNHVWYRGQSKVDWPLVPSLGRGKKPSIDNEVYLIKRFRQNATLLVSNIAYAEWDWLLIMQHHGVKTRLLDWTENPLVGLYFAATENPKTDGALWAILPNDLNLHSKLKPQYTLDIPSFDDPILENYSVQSIHREKTSDLDPIAIMAPRNTPRMQVQRGVFTIMHRAPKPVEEVGDGKHVWRYIIPKRKKSDLVNELCLLGINRFSLFPELESIKDII
jgi:hypothetical protein